jgi:DNA-binding CsgD family transcriptional regulator
MSKEEVLYKLETLKKLGLTYKGIAAQAGISQTDIYNYINRDNASERVHLALEQYVKGS